MSARPDLSAMHRSELEATVVSQAKLMERFRRSIANIALGIEDEGDRAYFGSTNDADELRELEGDMLDSLNILECKWMHGSDLYAELRGLRALNGELLEALAEAEKHFGPFADITINGQHDPDDLRVLALIRAAIAKARGEEA